MPKSLKTRHNLSTSALTSEIFKKTLLAYKNKKITKDAIESVLIDICKGLSINSAISNYSSLTKTELEAEIKKTIKEKGKDLSEKAVIGLIMAKFRGRVEGRLVHEIVKRYLK